MIAVVWDWDEGAVEDNLIFLIYVLNHVALLYTVIHALYQWFGSVGHVQLHILCIRMI
jgi:hypothetical protein